MGNNYDKVFKTNTKENKRNEMPWSAETGLLIGTASKSSPILKYAAVLCHFYQENKPL